MGKVSLPSSREIFSTEFTKAAPNASPELKSFTHELAENHLVDLRPRSGHFHPDVKDDLSAEAARKWASKSVSLSTREEMTRAWGELARDFYSSAYWGFPTIGKRVKRKKEGNLVIKMMVTAFTSFVGTKCLVLYFASQELNDPSILNNILLITAVIFSFSTLFYFVFRHADRFEKESQEDKR